MASEHSTHRQQYSFYNPMSLNSLIGKMGTGWLEPATGPEPGRNPILVPADHDPNHAVRSSCHLASIPVPCNISIHTRFTSLKGASRIRVLGYRIHSNPGKREGLDPRTNSRQTLLSRFRRTALPARRPAIIPIRLDSMGVDGA